jgi:hypothetical protein
LSDRAGALHPLPPCNEEQMGAVPHRRSSIDG